jgi:hypothetical protein
VVNTVLKMAYKRAKVATTINATSASEFFTQDVVGGGEKGYQFGGRDGARGGVTLWPAVRA